MSLSASDSRQSAGPAVTTARLPCQRALFDISDDVAYLNCAYISPLMRSVHAAGERGVARKSAPWELRPSDFFTETEEARRLFAALVGADADDIAIVPAASYGIAVAAANLVAPRRGRILVLAEQFPSNVYPWRALAAENGAELVTIQRPATGPRRSSAPSTNARLSPRCLIVIGSTAYASISFPSVEGCARSERRSSSMRRNRWAYCPSTSAPLIPTSWWRRATNGCSDPTAWDSSMSRRAISKGGRSSTIGSFARGPKISPASSTTAMKCSRAHAASMSASDRTSP
jgi:hypothetical protein